MESDFYKASAILKEYHQEHILAFYDELEDNQKDILINQILRIDFKQLNDLYINSFVEEENTNEIISPLAHKEKSNLSDDEFKYYKDIGINSIKKGELAIVTLAGGQGSRLRT